MSSSLDTHSHPIYLNETLYTINILSFLIHYFSSPNTTTMSQTQSNVGAGNLYVAGDQRNISRAEAQQQHEPYKEGVPHSHKNLDSSMSPPSTIYSSIWIHRRDTNETQRTDAPSPTDSTRRSARTTPAITTTGSMIPRRS